MQTFERMSALEGSTTRSWSRVLLESALALIGALIITGIIYVFQLYPRIPNISLYTLPVRDLRFSKHIWLVCCCVSVDCRLSFKRVAWLKHT